MQWSIENGSLDSFLIDVAIKTSIILSVAWLISFVLLLFRSSAASRHAVWGFATASLLGLPILVLFLLYFERPITAVELLWFPVAMAVQLIFTLGCALILSALTVHFRDIRDILGHLLTVWFFATPVIYPYAQLTETFTEAWQHALVNVNPMFHLIVTYQEILYFVGAVGHWRWLLAFGGAAVVFFLLGYFIFDRLRDTFAEEV